MNHLQQAVVDALAEHSPALEAAGVTNIECAHQPGGVLARGLRDGRYVGRAGKTPDHALRNLLALVVDL